jgi:hypothetical protein
MTDAVATRPKGRPRPVIMSMLLAVVTLGIFTLYWTYRTHQEIKEYSELGVGGLLGLLGLLIYLVISGLWLLLPLFGPIVWFGKVQGQLNEFWTTAP